MCRFFYFFLFSYCLVACSQDDAVPKNVLPPKKMEAVLWDFLLADETADYFVQKDSSVTALTRHAGFYEQLFQIHKITKADFKRSLQFYESHPRLLKPIFDSLQQRSQKYIRNTKPV